MPTLRLAPQVTGNRIWICPGCGRIFRVLGRRRWTGVCVKCQKLMREVAKNGS